MGDGARHGKTERPHLRVEQTTLKANSWFLGRGLRRGNETQRKLREKRVFSLDFFFPLSSVFAPLSPSPVTLSLFFRVFVKVVAGCY